MFGIRKYSLTLLLVFLSFITGLLLQDNPVALGEILLNFIILDGLYLNYNIKAKGVTLTKPKKK